MLKLFWIYADVHAFTLLKSAPSFDREEVLDSTINFRDRWFEPKPSEAKTQKSL